MCVQNSFGPGTGLASAGPDAEEAVGLHEDHHQQEGPAEVGGKFRITTVDNAARSKPLHFNFLCSLSLKDSSE